MKLIADNQTFKTKLLHCIDTYDSMAFATAWASAGTSVIEAMQNNRQKIIYGVIGTHFYQTHPDVLDMFTDFDNVKFILQPSGVFHPKIFVFWTRATWEVFIGSANLTKAGLSINTETVIWISSADCSEESIKNDIVGTVASYFRRNDAKIATQPAAASYRRIWDLKQPTLRKLAGQYGSKPPKKAPIESDVMNMAWPEYFKVVTRETDEIVQQRMSSLNLARSAFSHPGSFFQMDQNTRYRIAGLAQNQQDRWFGSMRGAGRFFSAVRENNRYLSHALDHIPISGLVTRGHFDRYIAEYLLAFPQGGAGLATATRLLALKRPDQFLCLDRENKANLCRNFDITQTNWDYVRYWEEIVERILDTPWWNSLEPENALEKDIWKGRVAMLDAIFYNLNGGINTEQ